MARSIEPNFSPALDELRALALEDENLLEALEHFAETGLPLFICEVDDLATVAAGNLALSYKLSDDLKVTLAAVRARKLNSENVGV